MPEEPQDQTESDDELRNAMQSAFGEEAAEWLEQEPEEELGDNFDFASLADSLVKPDEEIDLAPSEVPGQANLTELLQSIITTVQEPESDNDNLTVSSASPTIEQGVRHVVFEAGGQQFAIPLPGVREIDRCKQVTALPRTPRWLRGVTNLRGEILSVTDFSELLSLQSENAAHTEKIIVVHSDKQNARTALVVDRVLGIRPLHAEKIPADEHSDTFMKFATGIAANIDHDTPSESPIILIDPDLLFGCDELAAFGEVDEQQM